MVPPTPPGETALGAVLTGTPDAFCGHPGTAGAGGGGGGGGGGGTAPVFSVGGTMAVACAVWSATRVVGAGEVCSEMLPARSDLDGGRSRAAGAKAVSTPPRESASAPRSRDAPDQPALDGHVIPPDQDGTTAVLEK